MLLLVNLFLKRWMIWFLFCVNLLYFKIVNHSCPLFSFTELNFSAWKVLSLWYLILLLEIFYWSYFIVPKINSFLWLTLLFLWTVFLGLFYFLSNRTFLFEFLWFLCLFHSFIFFFLLYRLIILVKLAFTFLTAIKILFHQIL